MDIGSIKAHHCAASLAVLCGVSDRCDSIDALQYQLSLPDSVAQAECESSSQHQLTPSQKSIVHQPADYHQLALQHFVKGDHRNALLALDQSIFLIKKHIQTNDSDINLSLPSQDMTHQWLTMLVFNHVVISGAATNPKACLKWLMFRKFSLTMKSNEAKASIDSMTTRFCGLKGITLNSLPYNRATEQTLSPAASLSDLKESNLVLLDLQCFTSWNDSLSQSFQLKAAVLQLQQERRKQLASLSTKPSAPNSS